MLYDVIIIGGGPAGLTAAVYALRANKTVLVIEKGAFGGQITYSPKVENIPGFKSVSGNEFAELLVDQAMEQGAEFEALEVLEIQDGPTKKVITDDGEFEAKAVIIATGAKHRMLGIEGEEKYVGEGISFCAVCDGAFYKGKNVGVVGGGNSAIVEALLLADLANHVTVIQNLPELTAEKKMCDQLCSKENVTVICSATVDSFVGDKELSGVVINTEKGKEEIKLDGLFVAIGLIPQNDNFADLLDLDSRGYAQTDDECKGSAKGIFVAGDCRVKRVRQVTTAAADGAIAAISACDYIDSLDK